RLRMTGLLLRLTGLLLRLLCELLRMALGLLSGQVSCLGGLLRQPLGLEPRFVGLLYEIVGPLLGLLGVALNGFRLRFDLLVHLLPLLLSVLRRGEAFLLHHLFGVSLGLLDASLHLPLRIAIHLLDPH